MLRNASGLAFRHFRFTNRIEQRGFPVIDVPHDGHDGRPQHGISSPIDWAASSSSSSPTFSIDSSTLVHTPRHHGSGFKVID